MGNDLHDLNEYYNGAKIKKKSEKTNECIRNFYFSLLFSPLPFIFSPFFPAVFPGDREKLQKGAFVLYLCIVDKKSYCDVVKSITLHLLYVSVCVIGCYVINNSKSPFITLHRPSSQKKMSKWDGLACRTI